MDKKILYRFIKLIFSEFDGEWEINDYFTDKTAYQEVFDFVQSGLGISDADQIDLIYASFCETLKHLNGDFSNFTENDVILPVLQNFRGERSYLGTVQFTEIYDFETYLPVILEGLMDSYSLDEDRVNTDIIETWDHEIKIKKI